MVGGGNIMVEVFLFHEIQVTYKYAKEIIKNAGEIKNEIKNEKEIQEFIEKSSKHNLRLN
jgi:hypothetical protein